MQCIILAGGYGTRLRPLTYTCQKVLLPVMNRPMIMHIMDALPPKVDRVIVAANYRKEQISDYFNRHDPGREVIVNSEPQPLGTAGAVKHAEKYIDSEFMVVNSDIVSSLNIAGMLASHRKNRAAATISLWPVENVREFGVVNLENDDRITKFVEKPKPEDAPSNLINAGHYALEPGVLDMIPKGKMVSMEREIFPRIISESGKFYGHRFGGYWIDVGKKSNYILAHAMLLERAGKKFHAGENCTIQGALARSCVGNGVSVGKGAVVGDSVVYDDTAISEGAVVSNSIIGRDCFVGKGASLKNVILGEGHRVEGGKEISDRFVWDRAVPDGYPDRQVGNVIEG